MRSNKILILILHFQVEGTIGVYRIVKGTMERLNKLDLDESIMMTS